MLVLCREAFVDGGASGGSLGWWFWSRTEENLTQQENSSTPRGIYGSISSTSLEEVASCGAFQCFYS